MKPAWDKPLRDFYAEDDGGEIFQESPRRKAAWLVAVQQALPVGLHVRVREADLDEYLGVTGVVADYDIGGDNGADGSWPLVGVVFDKPVVANGEMRKRDGFYDDEIEPVEEETP